MKKPINVPFSEAEYEKICSMCQEKGLRRATIVMMLLYEGFPDFEKENRYGIYINFEEKDDMSRRIQIHVSEETAYKLSQFSDKTKVPVPFLIRRIVIPQMTMMREK